MPTHTAASDTPDDALLADLRHLLMRCDEFADTIDLRALFVAAELIPFRASLPDAPNVSLRVSRTIAYLWEKRHSDGRRALTILLRVLSSQYHVDDERHAQLAAMAQRVEDLDPPPQPPRAPITVAPAALEIGALHLTLAPADTRVSLTIANLSGFEVELVRVSLHPPRSLFLGQAAFAIPRIAPGARVRAGETPVKGGARGQQVMLKVTVSYRRGSDGGIDRLDGQVPLDFV